ncbi:acyl-CoA dehydrogenase family protein [Mycobacterium antarcticum]|uniref:acyl-CoA dehydrogenase family protein n=1 Tax=Mycolicibacterium sp. TUM20984 TaxID=3023368 RepID=UPI00238B1730|nr:acyl-CoA dehydrogenase family protein [Mycolicibacterium sp. TUM20984]GLP80452.1 acyl-CoA dehydrogenase [Mycolicibacterium sp. TUM20984]
MEFRYTVEQEEFRASLRQFLQHHAPPSALREVADSDGHDPRLWQRLCGELDLPRLGVPAEYGGEGATLVETTLVFTELGRALTPVPLATTAFAIEAVLRMGDDEQRRRLLPELLCGRRIGAFAATGPGAADPSAATVWVVGQGRHVILTGECCPVLHGRVADLFVVPAVLDGTVVVCIVTAAQPGVVVEPLQSFDHTRPVARLRLKDARAEVLSASSTEGLERVLDVARVLLAAEMLGGAEACLTLAVDHAKNRRQFNRPIGSFQAVKHSCADMMIEIDATRAAVMYAAMSAGRDPELATVAPLVKAQAADTYLACAGSAIQVHGGTGFTWEHVLHLHFRRARTTAALFGSSAQHRALLADRVGI